MPFTGHSPRIAAIRALAEQVNARMDDNDPTPPGADPAATPPADPPVEPATPPAKPEDTDTTDWKAEARKHETRSKDNRKALEDAKTALEAEKAKTAAILKAAGLAPDTEDPAKAAERVTGERDTALSERDDALARLAAFELDRKVERKAAAAGANTALFMDSVELRTALAELGDEPTDKQLDALVKARLDAHPHLAMTSGGRPPAPNRAQGTSNVPAKTSGVAAGADLFEARRKRTPTAAAS